MVTMPIRRIIEDDSYVIVATADSSGQPHIATGEQVIISGDSLLVFENWFCPVTLQNISVNARVSVVAFKPETQKGYQMLGSVMRNGDATFPTGHDTVAAEPGTPPVLTRFTVRIEQVLEFSNGIHSDIPVVA